MSTRPTVKFDKAVPVTVRISRQPANIDAVHKIIENVLGQLGCAGCLSGYRIHFNHHDPVIDVDVRTLAANVR